jgi:hypothetical protein
MICEVRVAEILNISKHKTDSSKIKDVIDKTKNKTLKQILMSKFSPRKIGAGLVIKSLTSMACGSMNAHLCSDSGFDIQPSRQFVDSLKKDVEKKNE